MGVKYREKMKTDEKVGKWKKEIIIKSRWWRSRSNDLTCYHKSLKGVFEKQ